MTNKERDEQGRTKHEVNVGTYDGAVLDAATAGDIQTSLRTWLHPWSKLHRIPVFKRVWFYLAIMGAYTTIVHFIVVGQISVADFQRCEQYRLYLSGIGFAACFSHKLGL